MPKYIDVDALMKEFREFVRDSNNSEFAPVPIWNDAVSLVGSAPTADVVPWSFLERYADWFCGSTSHAEFVLMAKLFWEREHGEREETEDVGKSDKDDN